MNMKRVLPSAADLDAVAEEEKLKQIQPMENHLWDLYRPETEEQYTPGVVLMAIFELLLIGFIFWLVWAFGAAAK